MAKSYDQAPLNDLKVNVDTVINVVPAQSTPSEALFLSNIDQTVAFPVETVHFYTPKPCMDPKNLVEKIRVALSELLVSYYPLAGRMRFNPEKGRLEIDCNAAGVLLAAASSELIMEDLGEIGFVNPGFRSLILHQLDVVDPPIASMQVTTFKCGGFAFGLCTSHALFDGLSSSQFLQNLAAMTRGEKAVFHAKFDRTCFKARDPPTVQYAHPELMQLAPAAADSATTFTFTNRERGTAADLTQISSLHAYRSFPFPSHVLRKIKAKAMEGDSLPKCSTFEAALAHVWQARVKSIELEDPTQPTSVLFAIDIRKLVNPPLSHAFTGNGVITAYAQAPAIEIRSKPLSFCVSKVREGIERVTSDYIKSAIDWLEIHKGIPSVGVQGNFYLSAWWKLPFHKVDFGWGEPIYAGPIMSGVVDMVLLISNCAKDEGLNLLLALQPHEMAKFECHIQV